MAKLNRIRCGSAHLLGRCSRYTVISILVTGFFALCPVLPAPAMLIGEVVYGGGTNIEPAFPLTALAIGSSSTDAPGLELPIYQVGRSSVADLPDSEDDPWLYLPAGIGLSGARSPLDERATEESNGLSLTYDQQAVEGGWLEGFSGLWGPSLQESFELPTAGATMNEMEWFHSLNRRLEEEDDRDRGLFGLGFGPEDRLLRGGEFFRSDPYSIPSAGGEPAEPLFENPFRTGTPGVRE